MGGSVIGELEAFGSQGVARPALSGQACAKYAAHHEFRNYPSSDVL